MSAVITLLGGLSALRLGVREYPAVDPPVVSIVTTYPGADASIIESQITEPIEAAVNAVAGIRTITSTSREGASQVVVEFDLGANLETAANDVRDKLGQVVRNLPPDADPPVVEKADADASPFFGIVVSSSTRDLMPLSAYADTLRERLQTVPGVSNIRLVGEKRYSMRLWLDPARLSALGITTLEVRQALQRENVELPSGRIEGGTIELTVRTLGRLESVEAFNRVILKRSGDQIVRLADVGYAELGPENPRSSLKVGGLPMVGVYVSPQPGANQIEIADELLRRLEQFKREKPSDIDLRLAYDNTNFVRLAIHEVRETMLIAFLLVVLVIFLFLRDWRSTLIPIVSIPVSIIGAFLIMDAAGFSINVLTLLGIVLAIGLVVDDSIVVLENIYTKIESGMPPRLAGETGTSEIYLAVVATTIALAAVFLPVIFLGGMTGRLFREFGVVIAGAVFISAFVALTLTPMLCVRLLRPHSHENAFHRRTEPFFRGMSSVYQHSLNAFLRHRWAAPLALALCVGVIVYCFKTLPRELSPLEDRGRIMVRATAPEGASHDYMVHYLDDLAAAVETEVGNDLRLAMVQTPSGSSGGAGVINTGFVRLFLKDRDERAFSQQDLATRLQRTVRGQTGARVNISQEPSIGERRGTGLSAQLVIQAATLDLIKDAVDPFLERARAHPAFAFVDVDLRFNRPELRLAIQREKAEALGVSAADIASTLQAALSGQRFGYFIFEGKQYNVIGQLLREDRARVSDLATIHVKSSAGEIIPLDNLVTPAETSGPPQLYRYNRFSSATVSGTLSPGYTLGQGVAALREIAADVLDERYTTSLTGASRDLEDSSSSLGFVFVLALLLVYLVLAAQFESFRDPFTILITVPLALAGALATLWIFGETLNIFSQIGLIMLIGLVTKNGILLVEFAGQSRASGLSLRASVEAACVARFRPILMTSACTILGVLPIALALGAGAESRVAMGMGVIGGLIVGTALTLYVVPAFYLLFSRSTTDQSSAIPTTTEKPDLKALASSA